MLTTVSGSLGYLQSIDAKASKTEDPIKNASGVTVDVAFIDQVNEVTATGKFDRDATLPTIGNSVTVASSNSAFNGLYYCTEVSFKEQNTTSVEVTVNLKRYVSGAIPAA